MQSKWYLKAVFAYNFYWSTVIKIKYVCGNSIKFQWSEIIL